jgi:outer membrane protein assembly factor BamB
MRARPAITVVVVALLIAGCGSEVPSPSPSAASAPTTTPAGTATAPSVGGASAGGPAGLPPLADMPMYRSDLAGSVQMPGPGPVSRPALAWRFEIGVGHYAPILYAGAIVAASSTTGRVVALDARTGMERWHADLGEPVLPDDVNGSAAAADGLVFISDPAALHALDAATGEQRWEAPLPNRGSRPKVHDGVVYAPAIGGVVGFDLASGRRVWEWQGPAETVAEPSAIVGDTMYVAAQNGRYYAVGLSDRRERWNVTLLGQYPSSAVVAGDSIYFASRQADAPEPVGELYAVDAATGTIRWRFRAPAGTQVNPGPVRDGVIYAGTEADGIYALHDNGPDYSVVWHVDAPPSYFPLSISADTLFSQAADGSVAAYAAADGTRLWGTDGLASNGGGPPLVSGGMVFSVLDAGEIRAYADPGLIARLDIPQATPQPSASTAPSALPNPFHQVRAFPWGDVGITFPLGMDAGPDGLLYVLDAAPRVTVIDPKDGRVVRSWGEPGSGPGQFDLTVIDDNPGAGDITVGADGRVYVADGTNHRVQVFTADGTYLDQFGGFGTRDGQFRQPTEIVAGPDSSLYVLDSDRVSRFTTDGKFVWRSADSVDAPDLRLVHGVAVRRDGTILVTREATRRTVFILDPANGQVVGEWPAPPPTAAQLSTDGRGHILALEWGSENLYALDEDGHVLGLRALGPGDKRTGLAATTDWGAGVWPVPVVMPDGHAWSFSQAGLVDLELKLAR